MEKYFTLIECTGYLASIIIFTSLIMKDIRKLRIINFIGCGFFVTYGILIDSFPIIISNASFAVIHAYYIWKLSRDKKKATNS